MLYIFVLQQRKNVWDCIGSTPRMEGSRTMTKPFALKTKRDASAEQRNSSIMWLSLAKPNLMKGRKRWKILAMFFLSWFSISQHKIITLFLFYRNSSKAFCLSVKCVIRETAGCSLASCLTCLNLTILIININSTKESVDLTQLKDAWVGGELYLHNFNKKTYFSWNKSSIRVQCWLEDPGF